MVTFIGTKNEPVTSVTIILPSFGRFCIKGRASSRKMSGAQYTSPINTTMTARPARMMRSRNSTRWEMKVSSVPSSWVCWGSLTPALG